jgi:hypothetical protein
MSTANASSRQKARMGQFALEGGLMSYLRQNYRPPRRQAPAWLRMLWNWL